MRRCRRRAPQVLVQSPPLIMNKGSEDPPSPTSRLAGNEPFPVVSAGAGPPAWTGCRLSRIPPPIPASQPSVLVFSPAGEPRTPKVEARFHNRGNSFKVSWLNQDDGGSPIIHYLVRYKAVSPARCSSWRGAGATEGL